MFSFGGLFIQEKNQILVKNQMLVKFRFKKLKMAEQHVFGVKGLHEKRSLELFIFKSSRMQRTVLGRTGISKR